MVSSIIVYSVPVRSHPIFWYPLKLIGAAFSRLQLRLIYIYSVALILFLLLSVASISPRDLNLACLPLLLIPNVSLQAIEDDGVDESQEDAVEVEPDDSIDGGVLVNGNDGEEHWGMNNE